MKTQDLGFKQYINLTIFRYISSRDSVASGLASNVLTAAVLYQKVLPSQTPLCLYAVTSYHGLPKIAPSLTNTPPAQQPLLSSPHPTPPTDTPLLTEYSHLIASDGP